MHNDQEKTYSLIAAGRRVHAAVDAVDEAIGRQVGLHRTDLRCLNILEPGPMRPGEIAERLELTSGAVTALLNRLEERGLATRRPATDDRRATVVELTDEAFKAVGERYRLVAAAIRGAFDALGDGERSDAVRFLGLYADALATAEEALRRSHGQETP